MNKVGIARPSTFNMQGHKNSRSVPMDPYLTEGTIRDHARKAQHCLEQYWDVFFMDHIWGAAETWRKCVRQIEMSPFQEALIVRGVREHAEEEDTMPPSVQFPIAYAAVLVGECLEEIDKVNESVVNLDLMVGSREM